MREWIHISFAPGISYVLTQWVVRCFSQDRYRKHSLPSISLHSPSNACLLFRSPEFFRTHLQEQILHIRFHSPLLSQLSSHSEYQHSLGVMTHQELGDPHVSPALARWGVSIPFEINIPSHQKPLRERLIPTPILPSLAINMAFLIFQEHCGRVSHIPQSNIPEHRVAQGDYHPHELHNRKSWKGVRSIGNDYGNEYDSRIP